MFSVKQIALIGNAPVSAGATPLPSQKRQARRLADNGSEQPPLSHRQHRRPGHDEVIQQPDIDQRQRLLQMLGQRDIRWTGFGQPRRMIVYQENRQRISVQRNFHDLTRIDRRLIDRAAKRLQIVDQPMLAIEQDQPTYLMLQRRIQPQS